MLYTMINNIYFDQVQVIKETIWDSHTRKQRETKTGATQKQGFTLTALEESKITLPAHLAGK